MKQWYFHFIYISIIAYLGYNYWTSVQAFKAFEHLNQQLNADSEMLKHSESFVYKSIEKSCKAYPSAMNLTFLEKSKIVVSTGSQIVDFIEKNKNTLDLICSFSGVNSPNNSFFTDKKIGEIKNELAKFHDNLIHLIDDNKDKKDIEEQLCLTKTINKESYWNGLKYLPLSGVAAELSYLRNQIQSDKILIINDLDNKTSSTEVCGWEVYRAAIAPKKATLIEGETFEADVYITSYSNNLGSNTTIKINGEPLEIKEGVAHYKSKKQTIGTKTIKAEAFIRNPLTGQTITSMGSFEYQVLPKCSRNCL
jgi:hypothetical protein